MKKVGKVLMLLALICGTVLTTLNVANATDEGYFDVDGSVYVILTQEDTTGTVSLGKCAQNEDEVFVPSSVVHDGITYIVTEIGEEAFEDNESKKVILPSTIQVIRERAFVNAELTTIVLSEGLLSIEESAFDGCEYLTNVNLPESLEILEYAAFRGTSLTSLRIPGNVKVIGESCFATSLDESLVEVILSEGIEEIGDYAFGYNAITSITLPSTLTKIGKSAFSSNSIEELVIPGNIKYLGEYAFYENNLKTLTILEGVETLDEDVFAGNELTTITIPTSVTNIGRAFLYGNQIQTVFLGNDSQLQLLKDNNGLYTATDNTGIVEVYAPKLIGSEYKNTTTTIEVEKDEIITLEAQQLSEYQQIEQYDDVAEAFIGADVNASTYPHDGAGLPAPTVQWYKDGEVIDSAIASTYSEVMNTAGTFIYHAEVNGNILEDITVKVVGSSVIDPEIPETPKQPEAESKTKTQTSDSTNVYIWGMMSVASIVALYTIKKRKVVL